MTIKEVSIMQNNEKPKEKILIVDDSEMNRSILADMLGGEYEILEAEDGVQAVATLQKQAEEISLVLLDMVMPKMDGFEVLTVMKQNCWLEDLPVVMISAESGSEYVQRAYEMGVTDFIARPFDALIVHRRVVNTLLLYAKQKKLIELVEEQIYEKERYSGLMIDILSHVVEFRNGESGLHVQHIHVITELLLNRLIQKTDAYDISPTDVSLISTASALHDIGKIAIDETILNKPGRLTPEEFEVIKTHSVMGESMLKGLGLYQDEPLMRAAREICRWHHERYDGRGYPDGLKGDEIPLSAQIVALADVYDALTSKRVYKDAYSHETAIQMILDGQCGTFNPLLLECLQDVGDELCKRLESDTRSWTIRQETKDLAREALRRKEVMVSERSLQLLDKERMKYQFFADMSEEIQFEYTASPSLMTLSSWGAKKWGLQEVIAKPKQDPTLQAILEEGAWERISAALRATTPEQPNASGECELSLGGNPPRKHRIYARSLWSEDDPPQYLGAIGKAVDIHDSWLKLQELEQRASHDQLTGLLNLASFKERVLERIKQDPVGSFEMVMFDLDKFKNANDSLGHSFGNELLVHIADKLRQNTRGNDILARVGGDEYMLFLQCKGNTEAVIQRIFTSLTGTYKNFQISLSMGVARSELVGTDYDTLFHAADQALYYVKKKTGRGQWRFYDDSMNDMLSSVSPIEDGRDAEA